jgi:hypothetical protein
MAVTKYLHETLLSISPTKDPVGIFLAINLAICLGVLVSRKWIARFSKSTRPRSPDLEKPASSPGVREKVTRNFGGR